jgi:ABC-type sugar transport system ATPase subunit
MRAKNSPICSTEKAKAEMSLLELQRVSKGYHHGARRVEVLREVSLELDRGEVIAVWGPGRSGRSTLLRLAGGIEAPDEGTVRFRGAKLGIGGGAIAHGIAYCRPAPRSLEGQLVLSELIAAQLAIGMRPAHARARALEALERAGISHCGSCRPNELDRAEEVRLAIARGLLQEPSLVLIDDPTKGVVPLERERILELLGSLAHDGIAVLMTLDRGVGLFGADRALCLAEGRLRGHLAPEIAQVVQMPLRSTG